MQVNTQSTNDSNIKLTITAFDTDLGTVKQAVLQKLAPKVKVAGFREGKVPLSLVEKNLEPSYLQSEFLDAAINYLYSQAISQEALRVVSRPKVELVKFVPYTSLEFTAEVEVIGKITLPDYKRTTVKKQVHKVTTKDIDEVLERLKQQQATFTEVDRKSKNGDKAWIDFEGTDDKGEPVKGAKGEDYPLALGSNTFIPGFEDNVIGLKKGEKKSFTITFPKDYGVAALQNKKVSFKVNIKKVEESTAEEINDAFAAKIGPFKTVAELKDDVKKQLTLEKENQANREFEDALIKEIVAKTKVKIPEALLLEQVEVLENEFKQNLSYRGQTIAEYLKETNQTEEQFRDKELKPTAEERIKAGLVLAEIAEAENIVVSPDELEIRLQLMKGQYQANEDMLKELDKPGAKSEIANRLLTEKAIHKLTSYATK